MSVTKRSKPNCCSETCARLKRLQNRFFRKRNFARGHFVPSLRFHFPRRITYFVYRIYILVVFWRNENCIIKKRKKKSLRSPLRRNTRLEKYREMGNYRTENLLSTKPRTEIRDNYLLQFIAPNIDCILILKIRRIRSKRSFHAGDRSIHDWT